MQAQVARPICHCTSTQGSGTTYALCTKTPTCVEEDGFLTNKKRYLLLFLFRLILPPACWYLSHDHRSGIQATPGEVKGRVFSVPQSDQSVDISGNMTTPTNMAPTTAAVVTAAASVA